MLLRHHMLHYYKCNIHPSISEFVTEKTITVKKTCVTVKILWFILATTNINQIQEVEYNTFKGVLNNS